MKSTKDDALDRAIDRALGPDAPARAPHGFVAAVETRLFYAALLERRKRLMRRADWLAAAFAVVFACVCGLFINTFNLPGWIVENVPGVLGRIDGMRVGIERSPGLVAAAAAAVILTGAGILFAALRPRKN